MKSSNKMSKFDKLDRRLLYELDLDSRQNYSQLGRKLGIPAETVRYRINNLLEHGVIADFLTIIDAGKLGNNYYKVLIKLHNVNEQRVNQIINYLVEQDPVNWVARMDGPFDIGFTIRIRKLSELSSFIDKFKDKYTHNIHRITFAVNIEVEFLSREYIVGRARKLGKGTSYTTPLESYRVDQADTAILRQLANNTRINSTDIAKQIGLSSETVNQRIRKLEREGVITRYRYYLNNAAFGNVNYYILIFLNYVSEQRRNEFVRYCRAHERVDYLIKALGEWDYELNVEVDDLLQYRELIMDITRKFSDIVRDYIGMPVSHVYKFTLMP